MTTTAHEPVLATDASRATMRRYLETGDSPHEIVADAIHLAENRGVQAVLTALGAHLTDAPRQLVVPCGRFDHREFQRRLDVELGRGTQTPTSRTEP